MLVGDSLVACDLSKMSHFTVVCLMRRIVAGLYVSFGGRLALPIFVVVFGGSTSSACLLCTSSACLRFLSLSSDLLLLLASFFIRTANILSAFLPAQVI